MSFGGSGGSSSISGSSDVALNSPVTGQFLGYSTSLGKWQNSALTGYAALPTGGGVESYVNNTSATGAQTVNLANGNVFLFTATGNITLTFSGATAGKACSFGLYITQDGTGNRTVTWPSGVKWAGGTAPTISTAANAADVFVFESFNGGTSWFGSLVGLAFS